MRFGSSIVMGWVFITFGGLPKEMSWVESGVV